MKVPIRKPYCDNNTLCIMKVSGSLSTILSQTGYSFILIGIICSYYEDTNQETLLWQQNLWIMQVFGSLSTTLRIGIVSFWLKLYSRNMKTPIGKPYCDNITMQVSCSLSIILSQFGFIVTLFSNGPQLGNQVLCPTNWRRNQALICIYVILMTLKW